MAVVLALALNLGALDGIIRHTVQEWGQGSFGGFTGKTEAKNVEAAKNKNILPAQAGPKKHINPAAEEAKENLEVKAKRTPNSKTFRVGRNEFKTEIFQEPVHFTNEQKELVDIDNTLVAATGKEYAFENKANSTKVKFTGKAEGNKLGQLQQRDISINWYLAGSKKAAGDIAKNSIRFREIKENTDVRYAVDGATLKEDIILKNPEAPTEFTFVLNTKGLKYEAAQDGSIYFIDTRTNDVAWVMPKPFMYDAKGAQSQNVTATIEKSWGRLVLTVQADQEWVSQPEREFPVVIDPTFQPGARFGRDTFISSTLSDTSFNFEPNVYVGNKPGYGDTASFFFFNDNTFREENLKITDASFSIYSEEGSLSAVKLQEILVDWVWDYDVLTWDYWNGRKKLGQQVLGDFTVSRNGSEGWWTFDIKDLIQK
jgi:hypothetical protein